MTRAGRHEEVEALEVIDAAAVRRWAVTACAALDSAAADIDALNVYPVPDGDTGTNLHLTLQAAVAHLSRGDQEAGLRPTLDRLARGALLGARGNSGVIVSQLLRGIADTLGRDGPADGASLASALNQAADLGYAAVAAPVEGTILTVARVAANSASAAAARGDAGLAEVAATACAAATQALQRTPSQLAVLARAGVVDAGGMGLCVLLDALLVTITGDDLSAPVVLDGTTAGRQVPDISPLEAAQTGGAGEFRYEVQFLLDHSDEDRVEVLRGELGALGDSLVIVGDGAATTHAPLWKVHVHVNDVGAAIEAGVRAGRPHAISVTHFDSQIAAPACSVETGSATSAASWSGRSLVAVAPGVGLAGLFADEGVDVVNGSAASGPSVGDVLSAIRRTGAAEVVVLPNHPTMTAIADAAAEKARAGGQDVAVVPTKSPVQGLAAIAVADPGRRFPDVVIALAEAAAATRWAEISIAATDAMTSAGRCAAGDVLGLAEGDVVLIGHDQVAVACDLLDRLLSSGGELVTLVLGSDALHGFAHAVRAHLRRDHPGVDVMDYRGDQPDQPVLIGVE